MTGFGMRGGHKPHRYRGSRRGSSGMKGFSAGASLGQGLTDAAQNAYNAIQRSTLTSGVDRAIFDRATMTYQVDGVDIFRGMYQLPNSPRYSGGAGSFKAPTAIEQARAMEAYRAQVTRAQGRAKATSNQFGAMTTGRDRGYPSWVTEMLSKANAPDQKNTSKILPLGLGILVLKVLI